MVIKLKLSDSFNLIDNFITIWQQKSISNKHIAAIGSNWKMIVRWDLHDGEQAYFSCIIHDMHINHSVANILVYANTSVIIVWPTP